MLESIRMYYVYLCYSMIADKYSQTVVCLKTSVQDNNARLSAVGLLQLSVPPCACTSRLNAWICVDSWAGGRCNHIIDICVHQYYRSLVSLALRRHISLNSLLFDCRLAGSSAAFSISGAFQRGMRAF